MRLHDPSPLLSVRIHLCCSSLVHIPRIQIFPHNVSIHVFACLPLWWRGTVVERRSLTGELFLSCARPAADG